MVVVKAGWSETSMAAEKEERMEPKTAGQWDWLASLWVG